MPRSKLDCWHRRHHKNMNFVCAGEPMKFAPGKGEGSLHVCSIMPPRGRRPSAICLNPNMATACSTYGVASSDEA